MTLFKILSIITIPIWLSACSIIYKQDLQQGNIVTDEMLNKLIIGMDKAQVRYYLGTPLIEDPFHEYRWDYYYAFREGGDKQRQQTAITLLFSQSGLLKNIIGQSNVKLVDSQVVELPDKGNLSPVESDNTGDNRSFWQKIKSKVLGQ